jgi:RNA polymerase sigma-70 factor (TIGR02943 family)
MLGLLLLFLFFYYTMTADNRLSEWVNTYTSELYSWAYHKVSDSELAKDLVQDTFLAAAEKIDGFKGESSPKTWLFSILNHKIIDYYRRKINHPVSIDNQSLSTFFDENGYWISDKKPNDWHEEDQNLLDNNDFQEILNKCLDDLPENWNICVRLKYLSEKSGEEICQEMDIAPTNLWQIIHRAKVALRECVENNWFKN